MPTEEISRHVSFHISEIPPCLPATVQCQIPRTEVPRLCEGLRGFVSEKYGAAFYYPNIEADETVCRYEWHVPHRSHEFGMRLGIHFRVTKSDLAGLQAYIAYGDGHPSVGQPPELTQEEISSYLHLLQDALTEASERQKPENVRQYNVAYYAELPHTCAISEPLEIPSANVTIAPTVRLGSQLKRVSAFVSTVQASFESEAKSKALRQHLFACALVTLAEGQRCAQFVPEWPKSRKPVQVLQSVVPFPSTRRLYPKGKPDYQLAPGDSGRIPPVFDWYHGLSESERAAFDNPLFSYCAAKELEHSQPTLAVVALLAAISPFARGQKCAGCLTCSACGDLQNFQHNITSDQTAIALWLVAMLRIEPSSADAKRLTRLLKRLYREQRSSYVHGAVLRHDELHKGMGVPHIQPSARHGYSDVLQYQLDLQALSYLTRKALLFHLSGMAGVELDLKSFDLEKNGLTFGVIAGAQVTLRGMDVPVKLTFKNEQSRGETIPPQ